MRELIAFDCAGETLVGSLDRAGGDTGLLIVSGGNEVRMGAHRGMARLAQELASRGIPVFRFDRRGIGDSTGTNGGYASSAPDIAAAAAAFRKAAPQMSRLVGFGNCDAATALVLFGASAGVDDLILTNPWLREEADELPPAAAIRARYAERLRDPRQWLRLITGGVNLSKLVSGLRKVAATSSKVSGDLSSRMLAALPPSAKVILAKADATSVAFAAAARQHHWAGSMTFIDTASHSFARQGDREALLQAVLAGLR
ncbi:MAG: hydrolase 1, exosortase A system-associated [Sphingomonas sp.]